MIIKTIFLTSFFFRDYDDYLLLYLEVLMHQQQSDQTSLILLILNQESLKKIEKVEMSLFLSIVD